ncbi:CBS domain-containing protein [Arsenicicoccus piscis]|uniref:Signal transduction protein n=1 Tax=Arsenicicoccus piscis TaxID=673954 RepID=A0ABQ6HQX2_9MICO|nr:CBS domain-containing protein [Arsenicicoccus piscis]MCH8627918.1 CBS domain-containing protein [Arsenicicoccus piscis]GMA20757.1 signal transduction protein [Arsenicicoccus piscis]
MRISDVVKNKGSQVVTMRPDATVRDLLALLAQHNIGAVVISEDGSGVDGIVSERDIVRHLAADGPDVLDGGVSKIMTSDVHTCSAEDDIESLATEMTQRRVRHVPVVADGQLQAIVTIGDVVKHRLAQLQDEKDQLTAYIQQ